LRCLLWLSMQASMWLFSIPRATAPIPLERARGRRLAAATVACALAAAGLGLTIPPARAGGITEERRQVVRRAMSQLGTDYRWGGETPRTGFDCSGLTLWTFAARESICPTSRSCSTASRGAPG
jgi:cell wall-associated NlpC family hydrolase